MKQYKFDPFTRMLQLDPHAESHFFSETLSNVLAASSTTQVDIDLGADDYDEVEFILAVDAAGTQNLFSIFVYCSTDQDDAYSQASTVISTTLNQSYTYPDWRTIGLSYSSDGLLSRSIFATSNATVPYLERAVINGSNLELYFTATAASALNHNIVGRAKRSIRVE